MKSKQTHRHTNRNVKICQERKRFKGVRVCVCVYEKAQISSERETDRFHIVKTFAFRSLPVCVCLIKF